MFSNEGNVLRQPDTQHCKGTTSRSVWKGWGKWKPQRSPCSSEKGPTCWGWLALERGMTIQMTLRLVRAALVVKVQGNTAVWPRATWILPELTDTSRGHTRPGKRKTPSSSISGEGHPVQAFQVAPYTCRSWQQHPVVTQLCLTNYFSLKRIIFLPQQIRPLSCKCR